MSEINDEEIQLSRSDADEIERLRARVDELEEALMLIAEDRGVCGACGKDADGPGAGYVSCRNSPACFWEPGNPQARTREALEGKP